jgi:predicted RNase H-like HicB family nuclease
MVGRDRRTRRRLKSQHRIEQEKDGRWIAEIPQIPGVRPYGSTRAQAVSRVEALALRVLAERIEKVKRF